MHGEQLALDQVGLHRRAHADGEVGLALRQVQFAVVHHQMDFDFGILRQEFVQPRQQPIGADAVAGGDLQRAARRVMDVLERFLRRRQPGQHVGDRRVEQLAFVGQGQAAGMALEQRRGDFFFQRADLAADRRLADRPSIWPAWVKLPADATAWKMRSLSQSMTSPFSAPPFSALSDKSPCQCVSGQEPLGFQRRHAAHARRRHRLAEHLVLDVAGREHARDAGVGGIGRGLDIAGSRPSRAGHGTGRWRANGRWR